MYHIKIKIENHKKATEYKIKKTNKIKTIRHNTLFKEEINVDKLPKDNK